MKQYTVDFAGMSQQDALAKIGDLQGPIKSVAQSTYDRMLSSGYWNKKTTSSGGGSATAAATPKSVTEPFERALSTLSGADSDAERMYQQGRRQSLGQAAMSAINAGAANTVNMPAMGIAYDEANRPAFNVGIAAQKAGVLQNLGQTSAGIYGTNVGAETSRYATDVGAATAASGQAMNFAANQMANQTAASGQATDFAANQMANQTSLATNQANNALQKYIADLNANVRLAMQHSSPV